MQTWKSLQSDSDSWVVLVVKIWKRITDGYTTVSPHSLRNGGNSMNVITTPTPTPDIESAVSYNNTQQRLQELDQRQSFIAVQRANAINATIALTDQITVIGFISSIAITLALVFAMIRSTNASLTRMKRGVERFGSGDLTYRIDDQRDSGEIGD